MASNNKFRLIFGKEVNFFFYTKSGSYGMYTRQIRRHSFGIPYLIGLVYTVEWGSNL